MIYYLPFILFLFIGCKKQSLPIFPLQERYKVNLYSDSSAPNGNSQIYSSSIKESAIHFSYSLGNGYAYPYVGMELQTRIDSAFLDASSFDSISITFKHDNMSSAVLYFCTYIPQFSTLEEQTTHQPFEYYFTVDSGSSYSTYTFALEEFQTPEWWLVEHKSDSLTFTQKVLTKLTCITLVDADYTRTDEKREVTIAAISLHKSTNMSPLILLLLLPITILMFFKRDKLGSTIILSTNPKAADNQNELLNYVTLNYNQETLSLPEIIKEIGKSEKEIVSYFRESLETTFEEFLQELRIKESKRLLSETTLQLSEIATAVGYGNSDKLYRIFIKEVKVSPSKFRKEQNI
jgi:AraC-like DNA-binding protein